MLGFRNTVELQLLLDTPTPSPPVFEGLPGYDPTLGTSALLTGKVVMTTSKSLWDLESLLLTFTGRLEVNTGLLMQSLVTGNKNMVSLPSSNPATPSSRTSHRPSRHFTTSHYVSQVQTKYLVQEQLMLMQWDKGQGVVGNTYEFPFAIHMGRHAHLPSSVNTPHGRVMYQVEATLIRHKKDKPVIITKPVVFTRCQPMGSPKPGIKIHTGTTKNGLFQYEITLPSQVSVDQDNVRVCVKLIHNDILHLPFSIQEVEVKLKEERVYSVGMGHHPQRIGQMTVLGRPVRYKDAMKETSLNHPYNKHLVGHLFSCSTSKEGSVRVMTFQVPIRDAVADMTMEEMTIRHMVSIHIEYLLDNEAQLPQSIDIPLALVVGSTVSHALPRTSHDSGVASSSDTSPSVSPQPGRWQDLAS